MPDFKDDKSDETPPSRLDRKPPPPPPAPAMKPKTASAAPAETPSAEVKSIVRHGVSAKRPWGGATLTLSSGGTVELDARMLEEAPWSDPRVDDAT